MRGHEVCGLEFRIQSVRVWGFAAVRTPRLAFDGAALEEQYFIGGDFGLQPYADMSGCQKYGPFLGTLNIRTRIIIGTQKGTHNSENQPYVPVVHPSALS